MAQEVAALRSKQDWGRYPIAKKARAKVDKLIGKHVKTHPLPTDKVMVLETEGQLAVLNCAFGSRTNEALGKLLSGLIAARLGESVGVKTDPYRIFLHFPLSVRKEIIMEALETQPEALPELMKKLLKNASYLRWEFLHTAKKFGVVAADYVHVNLDD